MKVVYHERYCEVYTHDPAAESGRIESIREAIKDRYDFISAIPATDENVSSIHSSKHIRLVKSQKTIYEVALLAVGGAIKAGEIAMKGEPAFGLIRPPGHHASRDSSWGFCYFNNLAISVQKLIQYEIIKNVVIVDFDLHFGDGTDNIFRTVNNVKYFHLPFNKSLEALNDFLRSEKNYDIISVSAGFDRHQEDWGGLLSTQDYRIIGEILKENAEKKCEGRVYAVLEGGYNHKVLGSNVRAFLDGLS